ncbi:DNA mismatch repair endonuclease MutL [Rubrivirga sp. S365]|uniref:DNA mismatch repair protein MutL n=1 Tax=Rubrivirga litoralis TaxID=3075598 RepID=A0ABU3BMH6_9BACT|nr:MULTISPECIES: DNA mismatch repair endonuclease MutL [unclassified Rubrivirga]MDT0630463.1 DNA mismatch repair endonuclease MutL [Rubrivirga sp. F394]MDT7857559.1 DNA mismatch repair endonuclease MutL [Rubrivirga sp. S365]
MPTPPPGHPAPPDAPDDGGGADDGIVRALPDTLASKIAAGEVVQRPANALKELVENALDAGASRVDVTLKRAGSELIQVADDGGGMGPRDAVASFGRHATSKLRHFEDLERLQTLGFRGEALASIASVAQVELKTKRRQDPTAWCVRVDGGEVVSEAPCAAPDGTCVSVRNLFYNVPARRAFLKTPATEFKHLVETFQALALSHPAVAFSLTHDDTEVWRLAPGVPQTGGAGSGGGEGGGAQADREAALVRRLSDLAGGVDASELTAVEETTSYLSVRGVVAGPDRARRSRGDQYLFVNGRYVKSRSLDHAVAQAFGALLPERRHPLFALFLTVDPRHVDVNVHPTKTEVKFDDDRGVYSFVQAVVKRALAEDGLGLTFDPNARAVGAPTVGAPTPPAPSGDGFRSQADESHAGGPQSNQPPSDEWAAPPVFTVPSAATPPRSAPPPGGPRFDEAQPAVRRPDGPRLDGSRPEAPAPLPAGGGAGWTDHPAPGGRPPAGLPLSGAPFAGGAAGGGPIPARGGGADIDLDADADRTLWQLHGRYLLSPVRSGLLVVDQRAAHERILYERAVSAMEGGMAPTQQLLFPFTVDLTPADAELLGEITGDLRALGFDLDAPAGGPVLVRGVPADVRLGDEREVLDDLLAQVRRNSRLLHLPARENLARSMAARSAIRPGQALGPVEARSLVDQLFACGDPFTDPAGRPTMIRLSSDEIDRRFRPS